MPIEESMAVFLHFLNDLQKYYYCWLFILLFA